MKIPLTVAIPDYLRDHRYDGRIVLPAAEALQILAKSLPDDLHRCDSRLQEGGEFAHLLCLDLDADTFGAFHEIAFSPDGRRLSRLTTLRTGRQARWTRSIEHVSVSFCPIGGKEDGTGEELASGFGNTIPASLSRKKHDDPANGADPAQSKATESLRVHPLRLASLTSFPRRRESRKGNWIPCQARNDIQYPISYGGAVYWNGPVFPFSSRRLYADLVPFGPAYHNVVGEVSLTDAVAAASVSGGDFPEAFGPLGSPFPIDAAMHVACAWGQRYRNCVAFPVGFDRREVIIPTSAGETYRCRVFPLPDEGAVLRFDIGLFGKDDRPAEIVLGLRMRDISGGRLKPPAWVRKGV